MLNIDICHFGNTAIRSAPQVRPYFEEQRMKALDKLRVYNKYSEACFGNIGAYAETRLLSCQSDNPLHFIYTMLLKEQKNCSIERCVLTVGL